MSLTSKSISVLQKILSGPFSKRQNKALVGRENYTQHDFLNSFKGNEKIALVVWELFMNEISVDNFKPLPEDDIGYFYGVDGTDLNDLILEALSSCNREVPTNELIGNIEKVGDVVDLVSKSKLRK